MKIFGLKYALCNIKLILLFLCHELICYFYQKKKRIERQNDLPIHFNNKRIFLYTYLYIYITYNHFPWPSEKNRAFTSNFKKLFLILLSSFLFHLLFFIQLYFASIPFLFINQFPSYFFLFFSHSLSLLLQLHFYKIYFPPFCFLLNK